MDSIKCCTIQDRWNWYDNRLSRGEIWWVQQTQKDPWTPQKIPRRSSERRRQSEVDPFRTTRRKRLPKENGRVGVVP